MTDLETRLADILRDIDAPVTAHDIHQRSNLPHQPHMIEAALRRMAEGGQVRQLVKDRFVHRDYKPNGNGRHRGEAVHGEPMSSSLIEKSITREMTVDEICIAAGIEKCQRVYNYLSELLKGGRISRPKIGVYAPKVVKLDKMPNEQTRLGPPVVNNVSFVVEKLTTEKQRTFTYTEVCATLCEACRLDCPIIRDRERNAWVHSLNGVSIPCTANDWRNKTNAADA